MPRRAPQSSSSTFCPHCQQKLNSTSNIVNSCCHHCGKQAYEGTPSHASSSYTSSLHPTETQANTQKLLIIGILVIAAIFIFFIFTASSSSPQSSTSADAGKVILFSTSWCSYCKQARNLFKKNNIAFTEYDVESDYIAYQKFRAYGGRTVPLIVINGEILEGYSQQAILNTLKKHDLL